MANYLTLRRSQCWCRAWPRDRTIRRPNQNVGAPPAVCHPRSGVSRRFFWLVLLKFLQLDVTSHVALCSACPQCGSSRGELPTAAAHSGPGVVAHGSRAPPAGPAQLAWARTPQPSMLIPCVFFFFPSPFFFFVCFVLFFVLFLPPIQIVGQVEEGEEVPRGPPPPRSSLTCVVGLWSWGQAPRFPALWWLCACPSP